MFILSLFILIRRPPPPFPKSYIDLPSFQIFPFLYVHIQALAKKSPFASIHFLSHTHPPRVCSIPAARRLHDRNLLRDPKNCRETPPTTTETAATATHRYLHSIFHGLAFLRHPQFPRARGSSRLPISRRSLEAANPPIIDLSSTANPDASRSMIDSPPREYRPPRGPIATFLSAYSGRVDQN